MGEEVLTEANSFYENVGYSGHVKDTEIVFVARKKNGIVGLARLCKERGILVLRGLYVIKSLQGKGIGTKLLEAVIKDVGKRECWCVPFRHLADFYSTAGFSLCREADAPVFLLNRSRDYIQRGMDTVIMRRSAEFEDGENHV